MAEQIPREQFSAWANIPARVLFDREISDRAKLLYGLISCMSNSYGFAFAKNSTLMRYLNVEERSLQRTLKQLLDSGIIGDVITFRTILGNSGPEGWSLEGTWFFDKNKAAMGALSDMGIHKVDLIQYLLGQKVIETTAKVVTLNKRDDNGKLISVDDNALCILKMSGGALGTMAASWTVYGHECQSTVLYGTKGLMMIYSEPSAPIIINDLEGNRTSFAFDTTSEKSGVIDEFVDALVHDRDPEVSGKEALTTMRTIFGSIRSSDIARPVAVNTDFVTHI